MQSLKPVSHLRFPRTIVRFPRFVKRKERNSEGQLLCICGKPLQFYSGLYRRGICSEACDRYLRSHEWRKGE